MNYKVRPRFNKNNELMGTMMIPQTLEQDKVIDERDIDELSGFLYMALHAKICEDLQEHITVGKIISPFGGEYIDKQNILSRYGNVKPVEVSLSFLTKTCIRLNREEIMNEEECKMHSPIDNAYLYMLLSVWCDYHNLDDEFHTKSLWFSGRCRRWLRIVIEDETNNLCDIEDEPVTKCGLLEYLKDSILVFMYGCGTYGYKYPINFEEVSPELDNEFDNWIYCGKAPDKNVE